MKWFVTVIVSLLVGLMASSVVYADKKVDFGDPNFPAPMDPRNHVLIPNEVTVKVGETVRFQVHGFHQVMVYEVPENTTPDDVEIGTDGIIRVGAVEILNTTILDPVHSPMPNFIHDHNVNFVAGGANPRDFDIAVVDRDEGLSINLTFAIPGTYLVLCGVQPHTVNDRMVGIVNVKPRGGNN
jgi:plastocyanin